MASVGVPKFHNDEGATQIRIGVKEFECMGARPPHDHPHIYLDMGRENEIICPYCSTHYKYDPLLGAEETLPAGALHHEHKAA